MMILIYNAMVSPLLYKVWWPWWCLVTGWTWFSELFPNLVFSVLGVGA